MAYSGDRTLTRSDIEVDLPNLKESDIEVDLPNLMLSDSEVDLTNLALASVERRLEPKGPAINLELEV